jgi:uncharacterized metal-binding protein
MFPSILFGSNECGILTPLTVAFSFNGLLVIVDLDLARTVRWKRLLYYPYREKAREYSVRPFC